MTRLVAMAAFASLLGCHPDATPRPTAATTAPSTTAPDAGCEADVAERAPGAELVTDGTLDFDGDGVLDRVYRRGHTVHGNADFLFYRMVDGCPTYAGTIESFIAAYPYCARPGPTPGACILVARVRMFHDDYQDELYQYRGGMLVHVEHGTYVPSTRISR